MISVVTLADPRSISHHGVAVEGEGAGCTPMGPGLAEVEAFLKVTSGETVAQFYAGAREVVHTSV